MFQFTPVMRRATACRHARRRSCSFNSRPSCDGRRDKNVITASVRVSIHARHATGDPKVSAKITKQAVSIHARHATGDGQRNRRKRGGVFQFTPVMRRATAAGQGGRPRRAVSIHARHATGDGPLGSSAACWAFQFTPVMRRATRFGLLHVGVTRVSIHARHATGDRRRFDGRSKHDVSIHARHATGDQSLIRRFAPFLFQFTPVMRRATEERSALGALCPVSIHARHATGDKPAVDELYDTEFQFTPVMRRATSPQREARSPGGFNSRPSCDGRRIAEGLLQGLRVSIHARHATGDDWQIVDTAEIQFQFTPVMRRATQHLALLIDPEMVSIHARHATGDAWCRRSSSRSGFNSRPSCDGRPRQFVQLSPSKRQYSPSTQNMISYICCDCTRETQFSLVKELIFFANLHRKLCEIEVRGHCMHHT